jgi:thiol-disulfide isomerase/thioredoxin
MPPRPPAIRSPLGLRHAQLGLSRRHALLGTAGLAAACAGAWWGWGQRSTDTQTPHHAGNPTSPDTQVGEPLPAGFWDIHFDTPDGAPFNWAGLQGKPLLLNFWATWCPPCVKEMPELDRFHREFSSAGWQVVGLAIDGPTPVKEFLNKVQVGFGIGLAGFGGTELAQALGNTAGGLPFTVLIDAQGRIRHRKMGATHFDELASWARSLRPA